MRNFRVVSAMLGVAGFVPHLLQSAEYTAQEEVNLSIIEVEQLLEVALSPTCCDSVSSDLLTAIEVGEIDRVSAIQFETKPTKGEPGYPAGQRTQQNVARVYYESVPLPENRKFQPKVSCFSTGSQIWFASCRDASYVSLKAEWMERSIRLEGDISNNDIKLLFAAASIDRLLLPGS